MAQEVPFRLICFAEVVTFQSDKEPEVSVSEAVYWQTQEDQLP